MPGGHARLHTCCGRSILEPLDRGALSAWRCPDVATCAHALAPSQHALAKALVIADEPYKGHSNYYEWLTAMFRTKRELLAAGLEKAGITPMVGHGGFFLMGDTSRLTVPQKYLDECTPAAPDGVTRDWALCRWLAYEAGVIAIPTSPFFSAPNKALAANYVRFAFCKSDETIIEACDRLATLTQKQL